MTQAKQLNIKIMTTQENLNFYNKAFTEQLKSLSKRVSEGELSPNTTAKEITRIAEALVKLNNL